VTIINDDYNANLSSTKAALQALRETAGEKKAVAVLGNMLELGAGTEDGHTAVGKAAASYGVEYLITVGDLAEYIAKGAAEAGMNRDNISTYTDNRGVAKALSKVLAPGNVVLVKGSRGMHMEEIVEEMINDLRSGNGGTASGGFNI